MGVNKSSSPERRLRFFGGVRKAQKIGPERLRDMDDAAAMLEKVIDDEECFFFLDMYRPGGVPSLVYTDGAEAQSSEDRANGRWGAGVAARPGYLGLVVDDARRVVSGDDLDAEADFSGKETIWRLFKELFGYKDTWYPKSFPWQGKVWCRRLGKGTPATNNTVGADHFEPP